MLDLLFKSYNRPFVQPPSLGKGKTDRSLPEVGEMTQKSKPTQGLSLLELGELRVVVSAAVLWVTI